MRVKVDGLKEKLFKGRGQKAKAGAASSSATDVSSSNSSSSDGGAAAAAAPAKPRVVRRDSWAGYLAPVTPVGRGRDNPLVHTPVAAFVGTFVGLGGLVVAGNILRAVHALPDPVTLVASFAALATLLFAAPKAPLGYPFHMFVGHTVSILIAIFVHHNAIWLNVPADLAGVFGAAAAIGAMVALKAPHPPAAACALVFLSFARMEAQPLWGFVYLFLPGLFGCAYMWGVQYLLHAVCDALLDWHERQPREDDDGDGADMV